MACRNVPSALHFQEEGLDLFAGAAVSVALEGAKRGRDDGVEGRACGGRAARREGRSVEFVVCAENERGIDEKLSVVVVRGPGLPERARDAPAMGPAAGDGCKQTKDSAAGPDGRFRPQVVGRVVFTRGQRQQGLERLDGPHVRRGSQTCVEGGRDKADAGRDQFGDFRFRVARPDERRDLFDTALAGENHRAAATVVDTVVGDQGNGRFEDGRTGVQGVFRDGLRIPTPSFPRSQFAHVLRVVPAGPTIASGRFGADQSAAHVGVEAVHGDVQLTGRLPGGEISQVFHIGPSFLRSWVNIQ